MTGDTIKLLKIVIFVFVGFCIGYAVGQLDCYRYILNNAKL